MPSTLTGTGNQPYTTARVDYLATVLQQELPELDHAVAVAWINQERGVNGNVLGVTYRDTSNRQRLYTYSSQEAGIRAAAALVRRSSYYDGIRAVLGKSPAQQALAIMKSPWNAPNNYGLRSTTYMGPLKRIATGGKGGAIPVSAYVPAAQAYVATLGKDTGVVPAFTANSASDVTKTLIELGIDPSPTHILTETDVWKITMKALGRDPKTPIDKNNMFYKGYAAQLLGQPVSKMIEDWVSKKTYTTTLDPFGEVGAAFEQIGTGVAFLLDAQNWTYILALMVGVPLALIGFYLLAGVKTGGENA